jgi:NADH-quinone oxidoreductase subunit L
MTYPLMILGALSLVSGFAFFHIWPFAEYISPTGEPFHMHINWLLAGISIGVAILGIVLAAVMYMKKSDIPDKISNAFGVLYKWTYNKFYFDEIYMFVTKKIMFGIISAGWTWFDTKIVDGTMNLIGNTTVRSSQAIKKMQSGKMQDYAYAIVSGAIALVIIFVYIWTH